MLTFSRANRGILMMTALLAAVTLDTSMGFISLSPPTRALSSTTKIVASHAFVPSVGSSLVSKSRPRSGVSTTLRMAADDFNESKYTEAAWSLIASLTKAADYYQASSIEAPIMLDLMLNPAKHNAGEEAESARRVAEKVLGNSGVDVKLMRMELDKYLSSQARLNTGSSKTLGQVLQKVLDNARVTKDTLGVS